MNFKPVWVFGRHRHWAVSLAMLALSLTGLCSCGIKAPPVPPDRPQLPSIIDLNYRQEGAAVTLSWRLAADANAKVAVVDTCRVYRAKTPLADSSCPDCPLPFEPVAEIPASEAPTRDAIMEWSENLESGFGYTYKVVCLTADGITGEPSDSVYVTY